VSSLIPLLAAYASGPPSPSTPSITDWISAIATAGLGFLGLIFTLWQWRASGFRPHYDAKIDASRTGISLQIYNRGRALGIILAINVAQPLNRSLRRRKRKFLLEEDVKFADFDDEKFLAFELPALTAARIIIKTKPLTSKYVLRVQAGTAHIKTVQLAEAEDRNVRFMGLPSLLPPRAR
jgi:hypothetical protein